MIRFEIRKENQTKVDLLLVYLLYCIALVLFFLLIIPILYTFFYSQDIPSIPPTHYVDIEDVIIKPVNINSVKLDKNFKPTDTKLFDKKNDKVAVFEFKSPEGTQGGVLVSDMFTAVLENKGYKVLERDNIEKILREKKLLGEIEQAQSDLDVANQLGQLIAADYMIFGAVTLYQAESQVVYLPVYLENEDRQKYRKQYQSYKAWYRSKFWPFWESKRQRERKIRDQLNIFELEELEERLKARDRREFHVIASIGISAKVVDVKSGAIRWLGQGETNDFTLVEATKRILDSFIVKMEG